uniref:AB hydrolase-1 domain-containing protein n=1 Tax=Fagus sylvatica TaxID=28930 RepID=A0A2N9IYC1_FAGSY
MGNSWACFTPKGATLTRKPSKSLSNTSSFSASTSKRRSRSTFTSTKKKEKLDNAAFIQQHALAAAFLFHHHQQNGTVPLNRSTSMIYPSPAPKNVPKKSSSSRRRSRSDFFINQPLQLVNEDVNIDGLETIHFVLVHGGGFGAWCWYKSITLLEECGYRVDAVDLAGSGIHTFDTNSITSLAQYVKPLTDTLEKLGDGEKAYSNDMTQQAQLFLYTNGKDQPPTAIDLDKALVKDFLFNQSPAKDVALALVSMRPIPFAPVKEKLSLSDVNYGSIPRFYIGTREDCAIPVALQENMLNTNPPEKAFWLKGSDHAPFFSRPQSLHKILVEISQIPPKQV